MSNVESNLNVSHHGDDSAKWGTKWCFTINSEETDPEGLRLQVPIGQIQELFDHGAIVYAIGSFERGGNSQRLHVQGWLKLARSQRGTYLGSRIDRIHYEKQRAKNDADAIDYAHNPEKTGWIAKAFEFGDRPTTAPGKRNDLIEVDELISAGALTSFREVNDHNPTVAARNPSWVQWRLEEYAKDLNVSRPSRYPAEYRPFVWQHWMSRYLTELPPDDRKVIFVCDKVGHAGKTRFIREFKRANRETRVQTLGPGKLTDLASAVDVLNDVLFMDIPRSNVEHVNHIWGFLEKVKDGNIFAGKYVSREKDLKVCHVVVFMNDEAPYGQTSREVKGPWNQVRERYDVVDEFDKPVFTHERYAIWNICAQHLQVWGTNDHLWHRECPPFLSFDENFKKVPYHPPFVPGTGPEFNGDMAGDGPPRIPILVTVWNQRIPGNESQFRVPVETFVMSDELGDDPIDVEVAAHVRDPEFMEASSTWRWDRYTEIGGDINGRRNRMAWTWPNVELYWVDIHDLPVHIAVFAAMTAHMDGCFIAHEVRFTSFAQLSDSDRFEYMRNGALMHFPARGPLHFDIRLTDYTIGVQHRVVAPEQYHELEEMDRILREL